MNLNAKKVLLIDLKPNLVVLKYLSTGKTVKLNRRYFEKKVDLGLIEVVNPEAMQRVL